jgi:hypothetical protein
MNQTSTAGDRAPRTSSHQLFLAIHDRGRTSGTRVRAGAPGAVLSVVPLLLGFMPESSLVLIGTEPPKGTVKVTLRYDLPDPSDPDLMADIAEHALAILDSQQLSAAIAIGYGPDALVRPLAVAFRDAMAGGEPALIDFLRVEGDRYWSYTCTDENCCPAAGVPFDLAEVPASLGEDVPVLASRAAVAASIAPVTGAAAESMRQATRRAEKHVIQVIAKVVRSARLGAARNMIATEGLAAVRDMIGIYRDGGHCADEDKVAWLTVALKDMRVRDDAWARMDPGHSQAHQRLWTDVVKRAQPGHVAGPASLLAFVAWQTGDGALANLALDRALTDDPGYSMATLLRQVISAGAPPSMARLPMTPEEVAACYEGLDGTDDEADEDDEFDDEDGYDDEEDYDDEDEEYELLDGPCPVCDVSPDDQAE